MSGLKVLSVASEIFPLVKTGGLADVVGALPAALARENVEIRTLVPGYPAVMAKLADAQPAHAYDDLFGGPARILAGKAAGLDLFAIDAPHLYDRPGNPYLGPDGLDWPDNAQRFRGARAGRRGHRPRRDRRVPARRSFTPMTGRRRSRPPICNYADRAAARRRHHDPQHGLPGPLSDVDLRRAGLAAAGADDRRGRIFRRRRLSESGPAGSSDRITTVSPDLRARDPDAGIRHGARRPFAHPRGGRAGHRQRHRRYGLESGHRRRAAAEL